ncbi:MAG: YceI family protein [Bdellovibrionales bacterium]|nr:YceI family protein [Bdellovibrionales bacterium]
MSFPPFDEGDDHSGDYPGGSARAPSPLEWVSSLLPLNLDARQARVKLRPVFQGALTAIVEPIELRFGEVRASFSALSSRSAAGEVALVVRSLGLVRPLKSPRDESRLMEKLLGPVLDARAHPEIRFRPLSVIHLPAPRPSLRAARREAVGSGILRVLGELTIRGMLKRLTLDFNELQPKLWTASGVIQIQEFGILPPRHFLGAIQVAGALPFDVEVDLRGGGAEPAAGTWDLSET